MFIIKDVECTNCGTVLEKLVRRAELEEFVTRLNCPRCSKKMMEYKLSAPNVKTFWKDSYNATYNSDQIIESRVRDIEAEE